MDLSVFPECSATCSTASRAPSRGLSGSTFTSGVLVNSCSSDTLAQAVKAPWLEGEEEDIHIYKYTQTQFTYFQCDKARLLLGWVWVYFDCLAGLELLQVCKPVACLTCTLAIKCTAEEMHGCTNCREISLWKFNTISTIPCASISSDKEVILSSAFGCKLIGLCKKYWTDYHEIQKDAIWPEKNPFNLDVDQDADPTLFSTLVHFSGNNSGTFMIMSLCCFEKIQTQCI